ncbi:hypothetical protein [Streptomyces lydicamycinicus]|uniref:hypothetical protein n=1 Tax=Streptomyces lydicamycinicus TaxID=1546107 RepID=UPI003C2C7656
MPETAYTQLQLFPDTAVTGSGKPRPWPLVVADTEKLAGPPQAEQLPFDSDEMRSAA